MILVDTSVWIDFFRGAHSRERQTLRRLIEDDVDLSITEIILTEILQGIQGDADFEKVRDYLLEFPIYEPKGVETYLKAAVIHRSCRKRGKTIRRTVDCIIAAICIQNDLLLFHKDSDFDLIEAYAGLRVLRA
ncbi:MAG: PIN domain nuclease [Planctomycetes bacterium]|nr:PIN domain nuclease [Planctomycetota bacterium]